MSSTPMSLLNLFPTSHPNQTASLFLIDCIADFFSSAISTLRYFISCPSITLPKYSTVYVVLNFLLFIGACIRQTLSLMLISAYFFKKSLGDVSAMEMYLLSLSLVDQFTTSGG